jgi:hypothetical protein
VKKRKTMAGEGGRRKSKRLVQERKVKGIGKWKC